MLFTLKCCFNIVFLDLKFDIKILNQVMILVMLPQLDYKMHVSSVNFSSKQNTRSIEKLKLWLRANWRSKRQLLHLLTVDFDPHQLFVTDVVRCSICTFLTF